MGNTRDLLDEFAAFISFRGGKVAHYAALKAVVTAIDGGADDLGRVNHIAIQQCLGRDGKEWDMLPEQMKNAARAGAVAVLAAKGGK